MHTTVNHREHRVYWLAYFAVIPLFCGGISSALGAPASWFLWKSKTAEHLICHQSFPGEGWLKVAGPFANVQCGKYLKQLKVDSTLLYVEPKNKPIKAK